MFSYKDVSPSTLLSLESIHAFLDKASITMHCRFQVHCYTTRSLSNYGCITIQEFMQDCSKLSMARAKDDAKSVVNVKDAATCTTNNVKICAIVETSKCIADTTSATRTTRMESFNNIIFEFDNTTDSQKCKYMYYYTQMCQIKSTQVLLQSTRTYSLQIASCTSQNQSTLFRISISLQ